jgi:hypothetical protein
MMPSLEYATPPYQLRGYRYDKSHKFLARHWNDHIPLASRPMSYDMNHKKLLSQDGLLVCR